jgi:aminoglycoside phosphotransferase
LANSEIRKVLVTLLFKGNGHRVELHPENIAVKTGHGICLGEADGLRAAERAGLPVPHVHETGSMSKAVRYIRMDYVPGQPLDKIWNDMTTPQKTSIARQLRDILVKMRSVTPPFIGACDGTEIRDSRVYNIYTAPVCSDEHAFNEYLISGLNAKVAPAIRKSLRARLRTDHRIVLSHCDLAPRNIMVQDGTIVGLLDWEDAGYYAEYWEYVKFFQRNSPGNDWWCFAAEIFPEEYPDELVDYIALLKWQYN